ncbi:MAG: T9SS type A sorting domain-containing protein [Cytophagaceae bacterium]|jgi:hypothetical protein|nr:T9SS type A sorting domain-containing protein [Cytophagaceae bacterium]
MKFNLYIYTLAFFLFIISFEEVKAGFCKNLEISGPSTTCAGKEELYSVNFKKYKTVQWSLSTGSNAEISSVSDIDLMLIKYKLGISSARLIFLEVTTKQQLQLKLDAVTTVMGITVNPTSTITIKSSGKVYVGESYLGKIDYSFSKSDIGKEISVKSGLGGKVTLHCKGFGLGWSRICGSKNTQISIQVDQPIAISPVIQYDFSNPIVGCNSGSYEYRVNSYNNVVYSWDIQDAVFSSATTLGSGVDTVIVSRFTSQGNKNIRVNITDKCGVVHTSETTIIVTELTPELRLKNIPISSTNTSIGLSCLDAQESVRLQLVQNPGNTTRYTITMPAGWLIENQAPTTQINVGNRVQRTYSGLSLNDVSIKSDDPYDYTTGNRLVYQVESPCGNSYSFEALLVVPPPIKIELPAQSSCDGEVTLTPIVHHGTAPFSFQWTTTGIGTFQPPQTIDPNRSTIFDGKEYGSNVINLELTDNEGCKAKTSSVVNIVGASFNGGNEISGWISGELNPSDNALVGSNLTTLPDFRKVYFTRVFPFYKEIYFYDFDAVQNQWVAKPTTIRNVLSSSNQLKLIDVNHKALFYINSNGRLELSLLTLTGQKATSPSFVFNDIELGGDIQYDYKVRPLGGSVFQIIWRDIFSNEIKSMEAAINSIGQVQVDPNSFKILVDASPDRIRYDMDIKNNRIFYFKSDGGLYYKDVTSNAIEIKLNGFTTSDYVDNVTDMRIDSDGNLYYVANGDIYVAKFDIQGDFIGLFKIETTEGSLPTNMVSSASGSLEINVNTNTLYFRGENGNIFQIYRKSDYTTTGNFGIIKSTPLNFSDNAQGSIIYSQPNVFYRSLNNRVYNLFYITNDPACMPQYQRTASTGLEEDRVNPYEESTVFMKPIPTTYEAGLKNKAMAYPVPVQGEVNIVGNGQTIETIKITGIDGSEIYNEAIGLGSAVVSTASWSSGVYLITLQYTSGKTETLKIIK